LDVGDIQRATIEIVMMKQDNKENKKGPSDIWKGSKREKKDIQRGMAKVIIFGTISLNLVKQTRADLNKRSISCDGVIR
jgi:hypothetical protein